MKKTYLAAIAATTLPVSAASPNIEGTIFQDFRGEAPATKVSLEYGDRSYDGFDVDQYHAQLSGSYAITPDLSVGVGAFYENINAPQYGLNESGIASIRLNSNYVWHRGENSLHILHARGDIGYSDLGILPTEYALHLNSAHFYGVTDQWTVGASVGLGYGFETDFTFFNASAASVLQLHEKAQWVSEVTLTDTTSSSRDERAYLTNTLRFEVSESVDFYFTHSLNLGGDDVDSTDYVLAGGIQLNW